MHGDFCEGNDDRAWEDVYKTKTVDRTDVDELLSLDGTYETRDQENFDPDELLVQGPKNATFTQEITDDDEFFTGVLCELNNKVVDDILLI